jgi:hypothetical protein
MSHTRTALIAAAAVLACYFVTRGVTWLIRARTESAAYSCVAALKSIDGAKATWALENQKGTNDTPTWEGICVYLGHGRLEDIPRCPAGGKYTLGNMRETPACSIGGSGHTCP